MKLVSLSIQGFRSFADDQMLRFPMSDAGFYLLLGRNEKEPKLGANGSGKSSLWDALCWVLWGKTVAGLRGKDVANRASAHLCSVCVEFEVGHRLYGLSRTWGPNSLSLEPAGEEPRVVSQEQIEQLLGITYEGFLYSTIVGQFSELFFDLKPAAKLAVLSEFLDLSVWDDAATEARRISSENQTRVQEAARTLEGLRGRLTAVKESRTSLRARRDEYLAEQAEILARNQAELEEAEGRREDALADFRKVQKELDDLSESGRTLEAKLVKLQARKDDARDAVVRKKAEVDGARGDEASVVSASERVAALEDVCPTCLAPVSADHVDRVLSDLDRRLGERRARRAELEQELVELSSAVSKIDDLMEEINNKLDSAAFVKRQRKEDSAEASRRLTEANARVASLSRAIKAGSGPDPYAEEIKRLDGEVRLVKDSVITQREKLDAVRAGVDHAKFWVERFRDVRLWIVEQALDELEVHVNNAMVDLGLDGYSIKFDIERGKADGSGVIRGFHVLVYSPESEDPIPWDSWSGGEKQRLRMASTAGIIDLVRGRTGFSPSVEVWDEPTAHLSQEGIEDLSAFLAARSRSRRRQIWLVDHRTTNSGDFDETLLVVKTKGGSVIKQRQPIGKLLVRK